MKHIIECLGKSEVTIEDGKVTKVTEPEIEYCPLFDNHRNIKELTKEAIKENIEFRIDDFGMCTEKRQLKMKDYLNFGISEIISSLFDEKIIDRAEYRILLRQDDADARLTEKAYELGIAKRDRYDWWIEKKEAIERIIEFCANYPIKKDEINPKLEALGTTPLRAGCKLIDLIARPHLNLTNLSEIIPDLKAALDAPANRKEEIAEAAEIKMKYKGYIERERLIADKMHRLENIKIKGRFNYSELHEISTEGRQKLERIDPETLAQASRIPGVSPSDINVMLVLLGR